MKQVIFLALLLSLNIIVVDGDLPLFPSEILTFEYERCFFFFAGSPNQSLIDHFYVLFDKNRIGQMPFFVNNGHTCFESNSNLYVNGKYSYKILNIEFMCICGCERSKSKKVMFKWTLTPSHSQPISQPCSSIDVYLFY